MNSGWVSAGCAVLALIIAYGEAQPQICAAGWPFPFCLDAAAAEPMPEPLPEPSPPPPPPCPALVETSPRASTRYVPAGPGGEVDVVFMVDERGAASVHSVSANADYSDHALAFVRSARWPTHLDGDCRAPYLARYTVMFPAYRDKPADYENARAVDTRDWSAPQEPQRRRAVELERISQRVINRFYPQRALRDGVDGRVELDCVVLASRRVSCTPAFESPRSEGFAAAAIRVSETVRVRDDEGYSPVGQRFTLPVRFRIEDVE